jgi:hypothetical protein
MCMRAVMGMYTGKIKRETFSSFQTGNGMLPTGRIINSRSTGKVNPGSRERNGIISTIPPGIIPLEEEMRSAGLPVEEPEEGEEGDRNIHYCPIEWYRIVHPGWEK